MMVVAEQTCGVRGSGRAPSVCPFVARRRPPLGFLQDPMFEQAAQPDEPGPAVVPAAPKTNPTQKPRRAPRYKVLIHNDDVTPMDFVVYILMDIFHREVTEATEIMLSAHNQGLALVTVLPLEEAEFRVERAHAIARTNKFPLTFTYEAE